jgi:hypothetical protein
MTRHLFCLLTLLATTAGAAELVGLTVPPYPEGFVNSSGACIAQSRGLDNECDYSIGVLETKDEKPSVIVGSRMVGRDEDQKARWFITDALSYPDLPEGYLLAIATCQVDGKDDETIVAAVLNGDEEWLEPIQWARRFDMSSEKFVEQPTAGVRCRNEAAGL